MRDEYESEYERLRGTAALASHQLRVSRLGHRYGLRHHGSPCAAAAVRHRLHSRWRWSRLDRHP
jgi:hypothetical protein